MREFVRRPLGSIRARWRSWSRLRRVSLSVILVVCLVLLLPLTAVLTLWTADLGRPADDARTRGHDAFWLGHAWVDGRKTEADVAALGERLAGSGITDLYVHTGPLSDDGSLDPRLYPLAAWFVTTAHRLLPGVRIQSWLGDFVAPEHDALHMADPATRDRLLDSVSHVLDLGFDGVHYDLEPVRSGSPDYLTILDRTRALTTARHAQLSVSAPQIDPLPGLHHLYVTLAGHGKFWAQSYFAEVARRVDQIAVMSYDTWMPTESLYGGYLAQQTKLALQVTPQQTLLLMGVPAFWAEDYGHHGDAETVAGAVRGARLGLSRTAPGRQSFGVALYVDFTATPGDLAAYRSDWCRPD
ncbi:glycoside hydrolase family 18 protein [Nocardia aurantia]|uniref:GH18 domain-containing protein n=1 Tax=Nocardia aurantia TaxID=2585199 RepID=A0A7K0E2A0_9NOCA|nr:hypothetical protein [Nocardia aurantia]MQY31897.1 hypothetical protein [Nocardia aurantia]